MGPHSVARFADPAAPPSGRSYHIAQDAVATIVIFGATGDLASRKLVPALYNLDVAGFLPERFAVVGAARRPKSDGEFRGEMCEALKKFSRTGHGSDDMCEPFVSHIYYHQVEFGNADHYKRLGERLAAIEAERGLPGNRLYYLATGPEFFAPVVEQLGEAGLVYRPGDTRYSRIVIEKPFGEDLESASALNDSITRVLTEDQIYRIDHYLGKETVQNILAFRFGNAIFEPLFDRKYVDHVQITVAETVGMEGRRGAFYETTGALRDVVQNHGLQLLCLVAMEPPSTFSAKQIRDEKVKVLSAVDLPLGRPLEDWLVRGQYAEGPDGPGYTSEEGVAPDSQCETYVALKLFIDNWRWAGVPFYIRTGKRLKSRLTEVAVQFKQPPLHFFREFDIKPPAPNTLVFRIQPDEAITLSFNAKPPGMEFGLRQVNMDFLYGTFQRELPEAYERLLLDAMRGDSTLFTRADEIEQAWRLVSAVREAWQDAPPPELYRPHTWGPSEANRLFAHCEGTWRNP